MVIACHCIFGAYGFWLPNDPRGSGSSYVASWELFRYGPATKTRGRRSVADRPHDRPARQTAKQSLAFQPVTLTGSQALIVAQGFAWAAGESGYAIHACTVLPDHVHLVIGRHSQEFARWSGVSKRGLHACCECVGTGSPIGPFRGTPWVERISEHRRRSGPRDRLCKRESRKRKAAQAELELRSALNPSIAVATHRAHTRTRTRDGQARCKHRGEMGGGSVGDNHRTRRRWAQGSPGQRRIQPIAQSPHSPPPHPQVFPVIWPS